MIRSREQRVQYETQPSKLFCAFESECVVRNNITEVIHRGSVAQGREDVVAAFDEYYSRLFMAAAPPDPATPEVLSDLPKVPEEIREAINDPLT